MYLNGTGVPQDYTEAARLLKLADDQGHPLARRALCVLAVRVCTLAVLAAMFVCVVYTHGGFLINTLLWAWLLYLMCHLVA